jgi:hypothetical protein
MEVTQIISPPGDNFTPRGQISPMGENFAPGVKVCLLGAKLRMGLSYVELIYIKH